MTVPASIDASFRAAALADGSVDAAYAIVDSAVGPLLVATTEVGICRVSFDGERELDRLCKRVGPRVLYSEDALARAATQLTDYFEGSRRSFDLDVDLTGLPPFQLSVLTELQQIGYGELATYGGLADRLGNPRAARAVGTALNRNPVPIVVPCHRVVGSTGKLVGYAGGLPRKQALLELEGSLLGRSSSHTGHGS